MRNLGLSIALCLAAILPTGSFALGLGEIEVNSFLNQPLNAEIEVLSARPGEIDDLLVSLASREAFTRAGLARPRNLSELKFTVNKSEDGESAVIVVSTRSAVKEPFLNFLVEADWSKGRLLREFTVLLDPPFYADQPAPVASDGITPLADDNIGAIVEPPDIISDPDAAMPATGSDATATKPIALSNNTAATGAGAAEPAYSPPAISEYVADSSQNVIQGDVLVVKGDTLWAIASRYKDSSHSMAQVMLAFQRSNPNAFGDGNINNLKLGAVLRAPNASEIDALGQQAAYAEVLTQNGLWDEYVARVRGVSPALGGSEGEAKGSDTADSGASTADTGSGELSLLMPGEGDSDSAGTGDATSLDQLRTKLALAEEELDASRIENKDLASRISELQARVSKFEELQKMIEIEDDSLAQLQSGQGVAATGGESEESVEPEASDEMASDEAMLSTDAISETIEADEQAFLEELLAEEAAAQVEEQAALQQGDMPDGESEATVSDEMADDKAPIASAGGDQMADDEAGPAPSVAPPAPVIITETSTTSSSMLDGILPSGVTDMLPSMGFLTDPIILAAIGGVILILLVLMVVRRRKAAEQDDSGFGAHGDDDLFASDDEEELTPIHLAEAEDQVQTDIKIPSAADLGDQETMAEIQEEAEEEDEFAATAIVSAADMPEAEAPAAAGSPEQDDVLNEVDVYLAYGLYENAEDLLNTSLVENPERADYRSKLLDTYFATRNVDAFVKESENLKSMGEAADPYWARVQVMGYELAPDNGLFSDAKDSGLSAADLEIAKPQEADFDLGGGDEDDTNFSSTDFNLGEDDTGSSLGNDDLSGEAGDLESTQQLSTPAGSADTDGPDDNDDALFDLPDDIGGDELEFSMDDEVAEDLELPADDLELPADELELPDDLDAAEPAFEIDDGELSLGFDMDDAADDPLDLDDSALDLDDVIEAADAQHDDISNAPTGVMTPDFEETAVMSMDDEDDTDDSEINLGMEDTALLDATELANDDDLQIDTGDDDDDEDISIIDFGGEDFVEPADTVKPVSETDDGDDDDFVLDDDDGEEVRTGTFAPGDFEEPTEAVQSLSGMDDMDDLMLPDDVDEVSTKLDLARAFIDMGDNEGARGSLEEVMAEGNAEQKDEAKALLDQIK